MSVGAWNPSDSENTASFIIDLAIVRELATLAQKQSLTALNELLPETIIADQQPLMKQSKEAWFEAAQVLSNEEILALIKFFTLAEMQLSGWEAGDQSPVIWLTKVLRKRKAPLSKELLLWIREHSDNRFLPNGAL